MTHIPVAHIYVRNAYRNGVIDVNVLLGGAVKADSIADATAGQRPRDEGMIVRNVEGAYAGHAGHPARDVRSPVCDQDGVKQLIAEVVAAQPTPQPFNGFLELTDVLLDIEVDGVRCIVLKRRAPRQPAPALTAREWEIARMVARGFPNKSIASVLQISAWTVSSHLRRMFAKLDVTTRAEMIGRLVEEGKFEPSDLRPPDRSA